ncbi:L,D-transpeptidase [Methylopila musalis]|uniref:L,D-transpeptidase n=1 Tax=Methylopila musalis TaxID=1134781 RepID=A0ABW3Z433_9HYPH
MSVFRLAPLAALAVALLAPSGAAFAQTRVIEAPDYVRRDRSEARVVERYVYDDEPRVIRRSSRGDRFIQDMFEDEPVYRQPRRIPSARERASVERGYGSDEWRGRSYRRYYEEDYGDAYGDPYEARPPQVRQVQPRYAGPPSGAGAAPQTRRGLDPKFARTTVPYRGAEEPGTIVINTSERFLYLVQADGTAIRYGVGVGKEGFSWKGVETISSKREWPDWRPPAEMRQRRPELPVFMAGGPNNPLGARALYLGSTLYRIHGSNEPWSIGRAVSSGCIRMTNEDVTDLYERVGVGTRVKVM